MMDQQATTSSRKSGKKKITPLEEFSDTAGGAVTSSIDFSKLRSEASETGFDVGEEGKVHHDGEGTKTTEGRQDTQEGDTNPITTNIDDAHNKHSHNNSSVSSNTAHRKHSIVSGVAQNEGDYWKGQYEEL
jgi:hypothetical protein